MAGSQVVFRGCLTWVSEFHTLTLLVTTRKGQDMRTSTKRRIGAVALLIGNLAFFRWQGYYGLLPLIPWPEAIIGSVIATIITLRLIVVSHRWF